MTGTEEKKIWVVTEEREDGTTFASAYDNEADANNYYNEMTAKYGAPAKLRLCETVLNRRGDYIPSDDAPWGTLRLDIKSEFVEGLMEDIIPSGHIKPGAAERFIGERATVVRRRTLERIDAIVRDETREELMSSHDDWCADALGMEH
ncbi:MAG: hypothetical protein LBT08_11395 [Synergistaceae bacterium]|nr:hypothetical protein [Synergistaceae bacterium]